MQFSSEEGLPGTAVKAETIYDGSCDYQLFKNIFLTRQTRNSYFIKIEQSTGHVPGGKIQCSEHTVNSFKILVNNVGNYAFRNTYIWQLISL